jgi:PadR family transcriptional regulator, regulatory protein AphA
MIQYILLGFLNYQPMTGYELKRNLDHSTGHFWHAYHSQIYTTLRQMEKDGVVTSQFTQGEGQPDRRTYTITEKGQSELQTWLDRPMIETSPIKEELLVRLFFSGARPKDSVIAELTVQRDLHQRKLAEYRSMISALECNPPQVGDLRFDREAIFWAATLKLGMRYEEAYIAWLNETLQTVSAL